jgi:hypothetical protein
VERIGRISDLEKLVLPKIQKLAAQIRVALAHDVVELKTGLNVLRMLRSIAQEETNQILHEAMLLAAAEWLVSKRLKYGKLIWDWNPRQTGGANEPDLRGSVGKKIVVSAEATTSTKPGGEIDKKMEKKLRALNEMRGQRYYFVSSAKMQKRAQGKISKNRYGITAVVLN